MNQWVVTRPPCEVALLIPLQVLLLIEQNLRYPSNSQGNLEPYSDPTPTVLTPADENTEATSTEWFCPQKVPGNLNVALATPTGWGAQILRPQLREHSLCQRGLKSGQELPQTQILLHGPSRQYRRPPYQSWKVRPN